MRLFRVVPVLLVAACVSTPQPRVERSRAAGMSLEEARALVAEFETRQAAESASDPLAQPKSLDQVVEILKRDQIDLFAAGVAFAEKQEGAQAEAVRAQIELAWGEAQLILAEVFDDVSGQLRSAVRQGRVRAASGEASATEAKRIAGLEDWIDRSDRLSEALVRLAAEHVGTGARLAQDVVAKNPSDYVGYRVAADFHRLRGDWGAFDEMVKKIEETNPESNGLVFLKGAAALQRDGDPEAARELFRTALSRDPKFTRAQAQLVLSRRAVRDVYAEYQKLRALNPHHQIVVWAGEAITTAFEAQRGR